MSDASGTGDLTEIGHILCKSVDSITRQALTWNPDDNRKRGRPRNTWRRDLEEDVKETGYTWTVGDWLRTGVPVGDMLAAYAPKGVMKALTD